METTDIKAVLRELKRRRQDTSQPLRHRSAMSEGDWGEWPSQPYNDMPMMFGESIHSYNNYEHDE